MSETLKDRIIRTLKESNQISEKDYIDAVKLQRKRGISLGKALIEKELINEQDLMTLLVRELNVPFIKLSKYKIDQGLQSIISEKVARKYNIVPLSALEDTMTIAVSDPLNVFAVDDIKNITGKDIDIVMSTSSEISKAIDNYYGVATASSMMDITKEIDAEDFEIVSDQGEQEDIDASLGESEKAPIIRMVNLILKEALKQKASDIHIEPMFEYVRVRLRIDGILQDILEIPKKNQNAVIVRIKIMSRLNITINQVPQDGRFKVKISGKEVDFRVSLLPTTFGQKVVMRVLDKDKLAVGLEGLGFTEKSLEAMDNAIVKPFGMILVTGPTGSGKSTTLYSLISKLNTVDNNIITIEDPVEYLVEGLTQIQAHAEIGLTFASGLRAILRQSPDVVMVGEIRDNETADIAIKAALTGQLVFSTLHTNDAAGALTRLVDMGVEPFLVASSIVLVSAQRLCRRVCENCKKEIKLDKETLDNLNYPIKPGTKFFQGQGCPHCRETGYDGRLGITEILEIDEDIRTMLLDGKSSDEIKEYARKNKGMNTLWEDAMAKCIKGDTTLEEVLRVTSSE